MGIMAIRNVVSTLPDPKYVAALEAELAELRAMIERQITARVS